MKGEREREGEGERESEDQFIRLLQIGSKRF